MSDVDLRLRDSSLIDNWMTWLLGIMINNRWKDCLLSSIQGQIGWLKDIRSRLILTRASVVVSVVKWHSLSPIRRCLELWLIHCANQINTTVCLNVELLGEFEGGDWLLLMILVAITYVKRTTLRNIILLLVNGGVGYLIGKGPLVILSINYYRRSRQNTTFGNWIGRLLGKGFPDFVWICGSEIEVVLLDCGTINDLVELDFVGANLGILN
jgi:hypothetical protein